MVERMARALRNPWVQFAILLAVALVLRCDTFGDPNLDDDDTFYYTVGIAMHHGALPYVDVWDRKPFGLFLIYFLIAGISSAPIAYQIIATIFAGTTAATIASLCGRSSNSAGGFLAGLCYLFWLSPMQGFGGQAPIFYNLPIAGAALLVIRSLPKLERGVIGRETDLAMLLAGCAITIKTTAVFEAVFLGLYAARAVGRAGPGSTRLFGYAARLAAIGAAPMALIAAAYWMTGHGYEFWHAVVISNLRKPPPDGFSIGVRALIMFAHLAPLLVLAIFGLIERTPRHSRFVALWLFAALVGLVSVPRFYMHYALPLLVPLCVAAGPFLARKALGIAATAIVAGLSLWLVPPFQFEANAQSREVIDRLAAATRQHLGRGPLFVYDGPPELYALTGQKLVTPLTFYAHLTDLAEKNVSHLSTLAETRRVLKSRPGVVVMSEPLRSYPVNQETYALVQAYVRDNCRVVATETAHERMTDYLVQVWGDCRL